MNKLIYLFVACTMSFVMASCGGDSKSDKAANDTMAKATEAIAEDKSTDVKIREASTKEEVRQLLNGTTWHYTENLDNSHIGCWLKVEFKDGKYTSYYALPSDGKWTKDTSGSFELNEGRYTNTGRRYISVYYKGNIKNPQLGLTIPCEIEFTTDDFQLNVHSPEIDAVLHDGSGLIKRVDMKGTMEYGNYSWD